MEHLKVCIVVDGAFGCLSCALPVATRRRTPLNRPSLDIAAR